jgi:hypothetical protein
MHMLLLLPFALAATLSTCHLASADCSDSTSEPTFDAPCKDPRGSSVTARHIWDQVPLNPAPRYDSSTISLHPPLFLSRCLGRRSPIPSCSCYCKRSVGSDEARVCSAHYISEGIKGSDVVQHILAAVSSPGAIKDVFISYIQALSRYPCTHVLWPLSSLDICSLLAHCSSLTYLAKTAPIQSQVPPSVQNMLFMASGSGTTLALGSGKQQDGGTAPTS